MLKTLNVPMLVRNLFFMLVAVLCCDAQAELIGNIECGNNKSSGETIVCDYTIIGNKYKKLFDLQFSDDRSKDIAVELRSKISECDALQCVEALIDQQTALPVDITTSSTPIKPAEKTVSVLPELSTRQVEEFLPPILVPDEKSGVDVRGLLVYVPLAVIIVGIIFKFLSGNSLLSSASDYEKIQMGADDDQWLTKRKTGFTTVHRGVNVKGGLLPKQAFIGGANVEVYFDGKFPEWYRTSSSGDIYKTDGNLQAFFFSEQAANKLDFLGDIVDIYRISSQQDS